MAGNPLPRRRPYWTLPAILLVLIVCQYFNTKSHAQSLSASDQATYRAAFTAIKAKQWEKAEQLAAKAKDRHLADVITWLALRRDDGGASFSSLTAFIDSHPDWPGLSSLQAKAETAMPDALGNDAIIAWFSRRTPLTIRGAATLTRAHLAAGKPDAAAAVIQRAWRELDIPDAQIAPLSQEFAAHLSPGDHVARLDRLLWQDKAKAARAMLPLVSAEYRTLAEARLGLMSDAPGVEGLIARVPKDLKSDVGLAFDRIRWRRRNNSESNIVDLLPAAPVVIAYPDPWWREIESAARRRLAQGDIDTAYKLASQYRPSDGRNYADAEWLAGWIALRFQNQHQTAYKHFINMYGRVSSPISRARGAYWAGRAAEAQGDPTNATQWYRQAALYPTTFYGQLAALKNPDQAVILPAVPKIAPDAQAAFDKRELAVVARHLIQIGESERVPVFLDALMDRVQTAEQAQMIVALSATAKRNDLTVGTAKDARLKGAELVEYLFPIQTLPANISIDPALALAIIRQESVFNAQAISSAGARGMMQLMPATAKGVAKKLKVPYALAKLTADPQYNIQLGSAYLGELLENYNGSVILTAAAYNAGPGRARTWIGLFGDPRSSGTDAIDWIESIPFSETRNYVQRVVENMVVYHYRLQQPQRAQMALQQIAGIAGDGN